MVVVIPLTAVSCGSQHDKNRIWEESRFHTSYTEQNGAVVLAKDEGAHTAGKKVNMANSSAPRWVLRADHRFRCKTQLTHSS